MASFIKTLESYESPPNIDNVFEHLKPKFRWVLDKPHHRDSWDMFYMDGECLLGAPYGPRYCGPQDWSQLPVDPRVLALPSPAQELREIAKGHKVNVESLYNVCVIIIAN